ncbi:MAG TPA: glycogen phosphorylase, partial [Cellvibrionaceae bacterium]|nr:glycogen phosphorylase [Cellvibrionaceae bacterium]
MKSKKTAFTLGIDAISLATDVDRHYNFSLGRCDEAPVSNYVHHALSLSVRDRLMERWRKSREQEQRTKPKRVFYLSLEFLLGRTLSNAIKNLAMEASTQEALHELGMTLEDVRENELDAGLGN